MAARAAVTLWRKADVTSKIFPPSFSPASPSGRAGDNPKALAKAAGARARRGGRPCRPLTVDLFLQAHLFALLF